MSKDLGDFQTPLPLVQHVISYLTTLNKGWTRALEPTCGQGNFITGLLHSNIKFSVIGPINGRPVIFDDTCYFIPCASAKQAAFTFSLLNDPLCHDFFQSIVFWDAKRPITKKLLQRVNLEALLNLVDKHIILTRAGSVLEALEKTSHASWPDDLTTLLKVSVLDHGHKNKRLEIKSNTGNTTQMSFSAIQEMQL